MSGTRLMLGELGEDALVAELCAGLAEGERVLVGPGDDCAVVETGGELSLLKTDAVVEGVHFLREEDPERVGWKAVGRVLSDFAAMGGEAGELMVTLAMEANTEVAWVKGLYAGMKKCLAKHGGVIVGGEVTSVPPGSAKVISVAGRGRVERSRLVTRSGGRPGDGIFVTGHLGGSLRGKHLDFDPRIAEARWLGERAKLHAMMDLSDGLGKDLPRLARMSGCGFELEENLVPREEGVSLAAALGDGEDFELLICADLGDEILAKWGRKFPDLPLTRIGCLVSGEPSELAGGWDHFKEK